MCPELRFIWDYELCHSGTTAHFKQYVGGIMGKTRSMKETTSTKVGSVKEETECVRVGGERNVIAPQALNPISKRDTVPFAFALHR